ncbi:hypothetical protein IWT5_02120 [Secundilactobacillus silagincola]|uniref:Lipoprotein n=1 Tax=Secundilactobacillus silagincola TaxID=1714681 RepID=A0A1Z5J5C2_9LACO|nr:hypothetical protein [Secundilactobacillus silagincola]GAX08951.1 hypothetical protein IWT5_02120 [Secundilactobacillus silagincola]
MKKYSGVLMLVATALLLVLSGCTGSGSSAAKPGPNSTSSSVIEKSQEKLRVSSSANTPMKLFKQADEDEIEWAGKTKPGKEIYPKSIVKNPRKYNGTAWSWQGTVMQADSMDNTNKWTYIWLQGGIGKQPQNVVLLKVDAPSSVKLHADLNVNPNDYLSASGIIDGQKKFSYSSVQYKPDDKKIYDKVYSVPVLLVKTYKWESGE